ncbi:hypothetical protein GTO89_11505 [Heliobacterium gestii]|uniref:Uncharacterized protein n=1 Tax=Heliomicrobium gestii TaxID=2699 RepID=A0A845LA99_HELGE|nr:hypothetical protein [Heliomicrobium gestii]MBM7867402.1 hypothetical protein [Heliomicrobium gestii]MZP43667.1 hypothetical protein [Heliomicrobium gestii]
MLEELLLETEPEWRLYEWLNANQVAFSLDPAQALLMDPDDPQGRVWFVIEQEGIRVRYAGPSGFLIRGHSGKERIEANVDGILQ